MKMIHERSKILVGVILLALVLAGINLFRADAPPERVRQDLSRFLNDLRSQAELLGRVLKDGSRIVVMDLDREFLGFNPKAYQRVLAGLEERGVVIEHMEKLRRDEAQGWDLEKSGFPYAEYLKVAERFPDVEAVIALCGLPYFTSDSPSEPSLALPKLLATAGQMEQKHAEALFYEGWIHATTISLTKIEDGATVVNYEVLQKN